MVATTAAARPTHEMFDLPLYPPTVPPVERPLPLVISIPRLIQNPIRTYPDAIYKEDRLGRTFAGQNILWVMAPNLIERILLSEADRYAKSPWETRVLGPIIGNGVLTAMGASWRWQRKATAPLFRHADVLAYTPAIVAAAETQIEAWRQRGRGPGTSFFTDVETAMKEATFDVIATTILSGITPEEAAIVKRSDVAYMRHITWEFAATVLNAPTWLWYPGKRTMRDAGHALRGAVLSIVARRRAEIERGGPANDVVGRLIAARHPDTGEPMSDEMIVNNLATFLEAGHQTTAQALTWTLYLLARQPQWQQRLRDEVQRVTGGGPVRPEHIAELQMTTRVLEESMRLYPPVATVVRVAVDDTELDGQPIAKDTIVIAPIFAIHRHRARWEDPDRFDPDRFLPERKAQFERGQYMPFGFGPRTCLGLTLAMVEGIAILATLLQKARFEWDGEHKPEPVSAIVLRPKGGMRLKVGLI